MAYSKQLPYDIVHEHRQRAFGPFDQKFAPVIIIFLLDVWVSSVISQFFFSKNATLMLRLNICLVKKTR
jgi:hypothetical protein